MSRSTFQMKVAAPSKAGRRTKLIEIMEFVRKAKGEWCLVAEYPSRGSASTTAWEWNRRPEARDFEFTSGAIKGKREFGVYCRLITATKREG